MKALNYDYKGNQVSSVLLKFQNKYRYIEIYL